jgi:hypothetical protein
MAEVREAAGPEADHRAALSRALRLLHGAVLVGPVFRGPDDTVDLFLTVQSNRLYVVQATTDFVAWVNIATNFAILDYIVARDFDAIHYQSRFYRAVPVGTAPGEAINGVSVLGGNQMTFGYTTMAGQTYILQTSTNLAVWQNLSTNLAAAATLSFTNPISPAVPQRFFRVLEQP